MPPRTLENIKNWNIYYIYISFHITNVPLFISLHITKQCEEIECRKRQRLQSKPAVSSTSESSRDESRKVAIFGPCWKFAFSLPFFAKLLIQIIHSN